MPPPVMLFLQRLWRWKLTAQRLVLAAFSAVFSILLFLQVCFRYLLNVPLFGLEEIAVYLALWVYFIGSGYAYYERYHISASLVDVLIPDGRFKRLIEAVALLISLGILLTMTVWCWQYLQWSAKFNMQSVELGLPMALINSISVIGLAVSTFYLCLEAVGKLAEAATGKPLFGKIRQKA